MRISDKAQETGYLVVQIVAKIKEPHTIAESTIKESCGAIVRTMFGPEFEMEVNKIPLADNVENIERLFNILVAIIYISHLFIYI